MKVKQLSKKFYIVLVCLIFILGFLLRLKGFLANPSFWHDECALGWNVKFKNFSDYFSILRFLQMAPPFFMITTKLITNIFGVSDFTLRILPFFFGIGSIIAFFFLCETIFKEKRTVLFALFLFAINQVLINYSYEFKPYSADVFFTIICTLFFLKFDINNVQTKTLLLFGFLLALVPWFSFVSVFVIVAGALTMFVKKQKSKSVILLILPSIISCLLYLKVYLLNNYTDTNMVRYWHDMFISGDLKQFLWLVVYNLKYFFFPAKNTLFVLILIVYGWVNFKNEKSKFAFISLFTLSGLILASLLKFYPFSQRLILFSVPILILLIAKPFDVISSNRKIKSAFIILLAAVAFWAQIMYVGNFVLSKTLERGENPRLAMDLLANNIKEDDLIFVPKNSNTEFYYYSSFKDLKNKVIQEPQIAQGSQFLSTIPKNKNCWFYLVFGNQNWYLDWISKNTSVLKIMGDAEKNSLVIYAHVK